MKIKGNLSIVINRQGEVWSNFFGKDWKQSVGEEAMLLEKVFKVFRKRSIPQSDKDAVLARALDVLHSSNNDVSKEASKIMDTSKVTSTIQDILNFFSEFSFEPNFRFINTLHKAAKISYATAKQYVCNYFELIDSTYAQAIMSKTESVEFKMIITSLHSIDSNKQINSRFQLHYGSQGTGKTTAAMKEANNNCMVCHSAMLPSDLMEDFKFNEGKADFVPSSLQIAMTEGKPIVLDEINLLPFESLRFLQSILDGKSQFSYKGKTIVIKDGFKILGTMNLTVNGCTYALPEPLVDRCELIKKYNLTANDLLGALI